MAKSFVPTLVDGVIADLGELLGARAFLDDVYADGAFPKLERDHRIIAIFDGSTAVNRNALINQFPGAGTRLPPSGGRTPPGVAEAVRTAQPPRPSRPARADAASPGGVQHRAGSAGAQPTSGR